MVGSERVLRAAQTSGLPMPAAARAAPICGFLLEANGLTGDLGRAARQPSVDRAGDRWVSARFLLALPQSPLQETDYIGLGPRSSGPFGGPVGGSLGVADNFPVGDFTPGTKEGPELWRWVEWGRHHVSALGPKRIVALCWSARQMCLGVH